MDRNLVTASTSLVNSIFGQPSPSPSAQHQNQQTTSSLMDRNPGQAARYKKRLEYLNRLEKESFRSEISAKNIIMPSNNQASNAESMLRDLFNKICDHQAASRLKSTKKLKTLHITPFCKNAQNLTYLLEAVFPYVENLSLLYSQVNLENGDFTFNKNRVFRNLKISFISLPVGQNENFRITNFNVIDKFEAYCWKTNDKVAAAGIPVDKFIMTNRGKKITSKTIEIVYNHVKCDKSSREFLSEIKLFDVSFINTNHQDLINFLSQAKTIEFHKVDWLTDENLKQILLARKNFFNAAFVSNLNKSTLNCNSEYNVLVKFCPNITGNSWLYDRFFSKIAISDMRGAKIDKIKFEFCHNIDAKSSKSSKCFYEIRKNPYLLEY